MKFTEKLRMAKQMFDLGYISEDSFNKLLRGIKLIEEDRMRVITNSFRY